MLIGLYGVRRRLLFDRTMKLRSERLEVGVSKDTGMINSIRTPMTPNLIQSKYGFVYNEYYDLSKQRYFDQLHARDVWAHATRDASAWRVVTAGIVGSKHGERGSMFFLNEYVVDDIHPRISVSVERLYLDSVRARDDSICFIFTREPDWIMRYSIGDRESACERIVNPPQTGVCASMGGPMASVSICPTMIIPHSGQLRCTPPRPIYKEIEYDWHPGEGGLIPAGTRQVFRADIEVLSETQIR